MLFSNKKSCGKYKFDVFIRNQMFLASIKWAIHIWFTKLSDYSDIA